MHDRFSWCTSATTPFTVANPIASIDEVVKYLFSFEYAVRIRGIHCSILFGNIHDTPLGSGTILQYYSKHEILRATMRERDKATIYLKFSWFTQVGGVRCQIMFHSNIEKLGIASDILTQITHIAIACIKYPVPF